MQVRLGNPMPHHQPSATGERVPLPGPCVTSVNVPDDMTFDPDVDLTKLAMHLIQSTSGVTNRPDDEALLIFMHPGANFWPAHSADSPSWVAVAGPDPVRAAAFQRILASFYGCPEGEPADLEETHYTYSGPPGVGVTTEG